MCWWDQSRPRWAKWTKGTWNKHYFVLIHLRISSQSCHWKKPGVVNDIGGSYWGRWESVLLPCSKNALWPRVQAWHGEALLWHCLGTILRITMDFALNSRWFTSAKPLLPCPLLSALCWKIPKTKSRDGSLRPKSPNLLKRRSRCQPMPEFQWSLIPIFLHPKEALMFWC